MRLRVYGSTMPGYTLSAMEALRISGLEAGICYMPDDFNALLKEPHQHTFSRVRGTIGAGHHSVSGHPSYMLIFEDMPKILAMLLNNEHEYVTSEKSGRYTVMATKGLESEIYFKWTNKFDELISLKYPEINERTRRKLALENARYFISVFSPCTTMGYTTSFRQINYIIGFCESLLFSKSDDPFIMKLKPWLIDLASLLRDLCNVEGLRDNKGRQFSLFAKNGRDRVESFSECYSVNYAGSFAQLAQAQRHRSLTYEMKIPDLDDCSFYVPPIIETEADYHEYLTDMNLLKGNYPQGMLVDINERGTAEAFILKCHERLCGAAQLEICRQTKATLDRYISNSMRCGSPAVYLMMSGIADKTKCQFGYYTCGRPCPLGPKHVFDRQI